MNQFHEVNELYDGKPNKLHHLLYSANMNTNQTFTFRESMRQEDIISFMDTMEK